MRSEGFSVIRDLIFRRARYFAADTVDLPPPGWLRKRGFRIIPATRAFSDPIADREPDTLFLNQGRVAALAHEAGWEPNDLISPTEDEEYLRQRFEAEVVALPAP